jgi:DNA uptake protein ComE-like DNA-binding protein
VTRRELAGCLLLLVMILGGRLIRHTLMTDPAGGWRDPGWLASHLPELPTAPSLVEPAPSRSGPPEHPLDPNTTPADSLQLLPGIGPALAERIVAARQAGLHFARARDLQEVRGIGPRTIARLEPYLVFPQPDSAAAGEGHSAR